MQTLYKYCKRCGRRLKTLETQVRGYGPICYEKMRKNAVNKRLFDTLKK